MNFDENFEKQFSEYFNNADMKEVSIDWKDWQDKPHFEMV